jgi:hypothetical protein
LSRRGLSRPDESSFRQLFANYRNNAKNRNLRFSLSRKQFRDLTKQPCYLCGSPPSQEVKTTTGRAPYTYNGVDRRDNGLGYTIANSVPCCWKCNNLKGSASLSDLIGHFARILSHLALKSFTPEEVFNAKTTRNNKKRAVHRNRR